MMGYPKIQLLTIALGLNVAVWLLLGCATPTPRAAFTSPTVEEVYAEYPSLRECMRPVFDACASETSATDHGLCRTLQLTPARLGSWPTACLVELRARDAAVRGQLRAEARENRLRDAVGDLRRDARHLRYRALQLEGRRR